MSELRQPPKRMTPAEFFDWQVAQDRNYELVDGFPILAPKAMTGASRRHDKQQHPTGAEGRGFRAKTVLGRRHLAFHGTERTPECDGHCGYAPAYITRPPRSLS